MIAEIKGKLLRKSDVYANGRRIHLRLSPRTIELWQAYSHTKMLVPLDSLWEYACKLHVRDAKRQQRAREEAKRQYWLEFESRV